MKEEQKIYVRGSKDRPNDVRKVLEQHRGKVEEVADFSYDNCIYYINHDGIVDYTHEGSELCNMLIEYYHEVSLPSPSEYWERGDILVNNNSSKFYVFDKFTEQGNIFVYLEVTKDSRSDKTILNITEMYQLISCTSLHKVNDKELKIFHDILAEKNLSWDTYNKELIQGNHIYFYPKNGHYYFKRDTIKCKDRTTGEWYDAVLYSDLNGQYVREVNDFNKKFKKI